MADNLSVLKFN